MGAPSFPRTFTLNTNLIMAEPLSPSKQPAERALDDRRLPLPADQTRRLLRTMVQVGVCAATVATTSLAGTTSMNGFDFSKALIPVDKVLSGGPPRDGIPSIDQPKFTSPGAAGYLSAEDQVVSVTLAGRTRAYPLRILAQHEIVNDEVGGVPVAVTYCPLCGTAMVFKRQVGDRVLTFGVSGLLFQSDVLMYDRQTESLWSQLEMRAVTGPLAGTALEWLPSEQLRWDAWRERTPAGEVLSTDTGFNRDYSRIPYGGYERSPETMFPVPTYRSELPKKEWVLGVLVSGTAKAYPIKRLRSAGRVKDVIAGNEIEVEYDTESELATVREVAGGRAIPSVRAYWFAWQAFHPKTELWAAP